jgi:hypothetical protein
VDRWENGFAFLPENCTGAGIDDPCDSDGKTIGENPDIVEVQPFYVWAGSKCTPFQWQTFDYQARARRLLGASLSKQIEKEFWTGTFARAKGWSNPYLANALASDVVVTSGTPIEALACLEQGLAECGTGQRGMIHATRQVVSTWSEQNLLRREGNLILTIHDTIVVPGAGYDGSDPYNAAPKNQSIWAYATSGEVDIRLSDVRLIPDPNDPQAVMQATDRSVNTIEWRAERVASAVWDGCCLLAAEVALDLCIIGGS